MAYPTDNTIRQAIMENVLETLQAIQPPTYRTTVRYCEHAGINVFDPPMAPAIIVGPPVTDYADDVYPLTSADLRFNLALVVHTSTEPEYSVADFIADVQLALQADVTRGGYASDTHVRSESSQVALVGNEPVYGTEVEVHIHYRHHRTDPALAL